MANRTPSLTLRLQPSSSPPEDCVVVEDVPAGVRAGKAAGARVIAFRTTCKDPDLRAAGADWVLKNCSQISLLNDIPDLMLRLLDA